MSGLTHKTWLIGVIYSPPGRPKRDFIDEFLDSFLFSKRKCLILGKNQPFASLK